MAEQPACQLRRRRSSGNPNLPLNLEVAFQVNEGGPSQGTPSPGYGKLINSKDPSSSSALLEFRKKQQSFDIQGVSDREANTETVNSDHHTEQLSLWIHPQETRKKNHLLHTRQLLLLDSNIEECEEEEIVLDSDDEGADENGAMGGADRPITPTPIQDFGANTVYTEGPQCMDFLRVTTSDAGCVTDVSDADSDEEEE